MVDAIVDDADQEEHAGRADAVGDHLEHGPVDAHPPGVAVVEVAGRGAADADAQEHVAHVAHRAVGDQPLEVFLGHGGEGPIDHAHDADDGHHPGQMVVQRRRQDREADAEHAVAAHLQQHPGQDHGNGRGGLDVGVGQPRVHRHGGQLDHEPDEQEDEGPPADAMAKEQRVREGRVRATGQPGPTDDAERMRLDYGARIEPRTSLVK